MEVRVAGINDKSTIVDFSIRFALEFKNETLDPSVVDSGVLHLLENPMEGIYYIAESLGKPIGYMMVFFEWSDWRAGNFYYIEAVYTLEECRAQGVFGILFQRAYQDAEKEGAALRTILDEKDTQAIEAFTNLGMKDAHYTILEALFKP